MRRNSFFKLLLGCLCPLSLFGCAVDEPTEPKQEDLHEVVFHAGWDKESKTVLQEDGRVFWSPGDMVSLFVGEGSGGGYKLTSTNTDPASTTDFVGQIGDGGGSSSYVAIYPFDDYTSFDGTYVRVSIPNWQRSPEGSFDKRAFINIAKSSDNTLSFRNLCGGIKFSVASEGIKEVHIQSGNNGGYIPSSLRFNPDDLTDVETVGSSVEYMVRPEGDYFEVGKYYYVVLPVGSYSSGFTIRYVKDNAYAVYHTAATEIKKSVFKRLYDKDADINFKRIYDSKGTIHSAWLLPEGVDKTSITEVHFYVNSDVETSTKLLGQSFGDPPIFFELQGTVANYYTSGEIFELGTGIALFKDWTSLRSVDLSSFDVQTDDLSYMFSGCTQLKNITWGSFDTEDVLNMSYMFENCWNLQNLDLSKINTSNAKDISGMFSGLTLKSLDLSGFSTTNVENMYCLFSGCSNLTTLGVSSFNTSNVTNMGGGCLNVVDHLIHLT